MPSCVVKWCINNTKDHHKSNGITFHIFPQNPIRRERWIEAVRLERRESNWISNKTSKICSVHFKDEDFYKSKKGYQMLKKTAVPICTMVFSYVKELPLNCQTLTSSNYQGNTQCKTTNSPSYSIDEVNEKPALMLESSASQLHGLVTAGKDGSTTSDLPLSPIPSTSHAPTMFAVVNPVTVHQLNLQPALPAEQGCSVDHGDKLQLREEFRDAEVDTETLTFQHMDSYHRTSQHITSAVNQETATDKDKVDAIPDGGVKLESIGKTSFPCFSYLTPVTPLLNTGVDGQQSAQIISTPDSAEGVNVASGGLLPGIYFTVDFANLVFGPAVLDLQNTVPATHQPNTSAVETENTIAADAIRPTPSDTGKEESVKDQCGAVTDSKPDNDVRPVEQDEPSLLYSCHKCEQTFPSNYAYTQHYIQTYDCANIYHGSGYMDSPFPFKCNFCQTGYVSKKYLNDHLKRIHGIVHRCPVCNANYLSEDNLRRHINLLHSRERHEDAKPNIYICDYCQKRYSRKLHLMNHITRVHAIGSYKCDLCDESFRCEEDLSPHKASAHIALVKECYVCGKVLRLNSLKHHMLSVHSGKKLRCKVCGEIAVSTLDLHHHLNKVHGQQSPDSLFINRCSYCRKIFSTKKTLRIHLEKMHGKVFHSCSKCKASFTRKNYLLRHIMSAHSEERYEDAESNIYVCDYCQKTFSRKFYMINHITRVHAIGSYTCELCDESFRCDKDLNAHKASAHISLVKECNVCGQMLRRNTLTKHMRSKHGAKKLRCKVCGEIAVSTLDLHYHLNEVHGQQSADSPFINRCSCCQKVFYSKKTLQIHLEKLHGKVFHSCSECKASFNSQVCLQRHIKSAHSVEIHEESGESTHPPAGEVNSAVNASTQHQDVFVMKEEPADEELELGPVVFQHMDCNYRPYKEEPLFDGHS